MDATNRDRRLGPRAALLLALTWLSACAAGPEDAARTVEVEPVLLRLDGAQDDSTGLQSWQVGLAKARLVKGMQGAQHIWVRPRVRGLPEGAVVLIELTPVIDHTGGRIEPATSSRMCVLQPQGDGWLGCAPLPLLMDRPCELRGDVVRIHGLVRALGGAEARAVVRIVPLWQGECG